MYWTMLVLQAVMKYARHTRLNDLVWSANFYMKTHKLLDNFTMTRLQTNKQRKATSHMQSQGKKKGLQVVFSVTFMKKKTNRQFSCDETPHDMYIWQHISNDPCHHIKIQWKSEFNQDLAKIWNKFILLLMQMCQ